MTKIEIVLIMVLAICLALLCLKKNTENESKRKNTIKITASIHVPFTGRIGVSNIFLNPGYNSIYLYQPSFIHNADPVCQVF